MNDLIQEKINKLAKQNIEIKFTENFPMKMIYYLTPENDAKMTFYLAPKFNDDE